MKIAQYEKDHLKKIRSGLAECMVLLKSKGDFPLEKPCKVALYGSGARHTVKGGTGSGEVNSHFYISVEKGLKLAGFTVTSGNWLYAYDGVRAAAHQKYLDEIHREARKAHRPAATMAMGKVQPEPEYDLPLDAEGDTAVYVLSRISGEGNDRHPVKGDVLLTDTEVRDIKEANRKYDHFILVLNTGGPVDLSPVADVDNILVMSQLGTESGLALAQVLLGRMYPSGKLTTTWTSWPDYPTIGEFGNQDDTRYKEGIYVGYRYFDSVGKPVMFPFGFGLGYTTFAYDKPSVSVDGASVYVRTTLKNTGAREGRETLQLYVSVPEEKLDQPYQTLAGWQKSWELLPGDMEEIEIYFDFRDLASWDAENGAWILEKGRYILRLGTSSRDTEIVGALELDEDVTVRKAKNVLGTPDFEDWKPEKDHSENEADDLNDITVLKMDSAALTEPDVVYDTENEVDETIHDLDDTGLAYLNTGYFNPKGALLSIIGNAAVTVCGAAGETVHAKEVPSLQDLDMPTLVMADGPAGLRLSKHYFEDEKGKHAIGLPFPATTLELLPKSARWFMKVTSAKPKNHEVQHQYCTAVPIGTAIAQSWNPDFARLCGDVVGEEMERFGVDIWLAPALNIHRSILCGRNFEYYSEDPLIAGTFAAAMTEGVQKHPGRAVTIKHYAGNNQETNRCNNSSDVSERAMREIYLRGFGIAVKEAQPHAVMTSYNLLNGIHTSESKGLIEDILRAEFGYEGIVMTDWNVPGQTTPGKYRNPEAGRVAAAGSELYMPGTKADVEDILNKLHDGTLTRRQLEENATRLYHMALKLKSEQQVNEDR